MRGAARLGLALLLTTGSVWAWGGTIAVDYATDAGGAHSDPLDGLAARATFTTSGNDLSILLENTSTGTPASFNTAASLLASLAMNLPEGIWFAAGDSAVIGPGSVGLGAWLGRSEGDSVAEQWVWTNGGGGDLLGAYAQVISTTNVPGGAGTRFDGGAPDVDGPFGGIVANPVLLSIPASKPAVSDSIVFRLVLSTPLADDQLAAVAHGSIVEFGSDQRYLRATRVPEPAAGMAALALLALARRRG